MVALAPLRTAVQVLNFSLVLSTAFMLWKSLSVLSDSHSPIVVVLSGSMEPAFQRGDLLFLWNRNGIIPYDLPCVFGIGGVSRCGKDGAAGERKDAALGEIVVYEVRGKDIPIVHRVVRRFGGG
jgi:signal peptidase